MICVDGPQSTRQFFNLSGIEQRLVAQDPALLLSLLVRMQGPRQFPKMLAGMIEIDDWNRAREVPTGDIPDPLGSVADDHLLLRPAPAAFPGFSVEARAER